jgi:hypothetical protein
VFVRYKYADEAQKAVDRLDGIIIPIIINQSLLLFFFFLLLIALTIV